MASAPGSAPDVIARIVTDRLAQIWGQQVLIINRAGAGGLIALQAVAAAERDNHTLYLPSSSSLVVLPETNKPAARPPEGHRADQSRRRAALRDRRQQPVGVSTLPELIALAKKKPGELTYAANFRGSLPNMTGEMFRTKAGIDMTFVPYPGRPQGCRMCSADGSRRWWRALRLHGGAACNSVKPLAVSSPKRLPNMPELPTVAETLPGFTSSGWWLARADRAAGQCGRQDQRGHADRAGESGGPGRGSRSLRPTSAICRRPKPVNSSATSRTPGVRLSSNSASRRNDAGDPAAQEKGAPWGAPFIMIQ